VLIVTVQSKSSEGICHKISFSKNPYILFLGDCLENKCENLYPLMLQSFGTVGRVRGRHLIRKKKLALTPKFTRKMAVKIIKM